MHDGGDGEKEKEEQEVKEWQPLINLTDEGRMQAHKSHLPAGKQETLSLNLVDLDKVLDSKPE